MSAPGGAGWEGVRVSVNLIARARAGDGEAFRQLTGPHRRELRVHCYRIVGSVQDAEDAVQDTLLAAWSGLPGFEERGPVEGGSSIRAWLYRVATNRCLNAVRSAGRRPRAGWRVAEVAPLEPTRREGGWLGTYPDLLFGRLADHAPRPGARGEDSRAVPPGVVPPPPVAPAPARGVVRRSGGRALR